MIGVIIGHDIYKKGMTIYNGMTEFQFNYNIAQTINTLKPHNIMTFSRPVMPFHHACKAIARTVSEFNIDTTVELHLNAFDNKTKILGCEVITLDSEPSNFLAEHFENSFKKEYNFQVRGRRVLKSKGRGYLNLKNMERVGVKRSIIIEPCFADVSHIDSRQIIEQPDRYARFIIETLESL